MGDPVTASIAISATSAAFSAYSQYQAGQANANYMNFLASQSREMANLQKQTGELNAGFMTEAGAEQLHKFKTSAKKFQASQRAAQAAMGIEGKTAEDVAVSTFNQIEQDERAIMHNADVEIFKAKYGANMAAFQSNQMAEQYGMGAGIARNVGNMRAFGSLLSGAADVGMMVNRYNYGKSRGIEDQLLNTVDTGIRSPYYRGKGAIYS